MVQPCLSLGPILEEVVTSLGDRVSLAKVNVDRDPELSASYQVRGIPAVKIFREGEIVGNSWGPCPDRKSSQFLNPLCLTKTTTGETGRHPR